MELWFWFLLLAPGFGLGHCLFWLTYSHAHGAVWDLLFGDLRPRDLLSRDVHAVVCIFLL